MKIPPQRGFRALFRRSVDGYPDYMLLCNQCETRERCFGAFPHDIAQVHHQFWHTKPITIPTGWANPGGSRMCDHRQCPPDKCQGC